MRIETTTLLAASLCIAGVVVGRVFHVDELVQTALAVLGILVAASFPALRKGQS